MFRSCGRPSWMSGRRHGCAGVVERPSRMSGSGRETLPDVREALPDVREALRMPRSVWKALSDIREALSNVREWLGGLPRSSGGPPKCLRVVWRPYRMSLRGGSPFWMSGNCQEALPDVRELLGDPPRCP